MKKRLSIALFLLLILSTYNIQNNFSLSSQLTIKKIDIENNLFIEEEIIKKKIIFLYSTNLFLLKNDDIKSKLMEIDFIESFEIKRIYPNKIKIKIFEEKPIAVIFNKKQKNFFTESGRVTKFFDSDKFKKLPLVFGDSKNFEIFYKNLKKINFPISNIKKFYLFESKRWDLVTVENQTIKLPINNYDQSLINYLDLKNQVNFKKYIIFDYRINNQLILR